MRDDQEHGAAAAAREEAARQTVWLAAMLVAVPVLAWAERRFTNPDTLKMMRMRAALTAQKVCAAAAAELLELADRARKAYDHECA